VVAQEWIRRLRHDQRTPKGEEQSAACAHFSVSSGHSSPMRAKRPSAARYCPLRCASDLYAATRSRSRGWRTGPEPRPQQRLARGVAMIRSGQI
jgi:hypothetical protein